MLNLWLSVSMSEKYLKWLSYFFKNEEKEKEKAKKENKQKREGGRKGEKLTYDTNVNK